APCRGVGCQRFSEPDLSPLLYKSIRAGKAVKWRVVIDLMVQVYSPIDGKPNRVVILCLEVTFVQVY
ncbi:MAG: hypothetical protein JWP57_1815, partial [Spirosoma sp.]|nr:hypothetical protein [Spirosoma sp.]